METPKFPHSLSYIYNKTGLPVTSHNKFWDKTVRYAIQNGGKYNFVIDDLNRKSLPNDQAFWNDLFANATKWGLKTYEQDWMYRLFNVSYCKVCLGNSEVINWKLIF